MVVFNKHSHVYVRMLLCVFTTFLSFALRGEYGIRYGIGPQYSVVCHMDEDFGVEQNCRKVLCDELDTYGGQPVVQGIIGDKTDSWMLANFSQLPRGYLKTLPKTNLAQDKVKKDRQDRYLSYVKIIQGNVRYAYGQSLGLGLPMGKFAVLADKYKKLAVSKTWISLGEREPKKFKAAEAALIQFINDVHEINVSIYDDVLAAKKQLFSAYALRNPQIVQAIRMRKQQKDLERRVQIAERAAAAAEAEAEDARQAAMRAQFEASEANRRAGNAEQRLRANGVW